MRMLRYRLCDLPSFYSWLDMKPGYEDTILSLEALVSNIWQTASDKHNREVKRIELFNLDRKEGDMPLILLSIFFSRK